ncbi:MAG: hypothetical protein H7Y88_04530, partial [Phycisphaerales bacterium]|nr:hypothetical protein [Phycisphaerales bacterium]
MLTLLAGGVGLAACESDRDNRTHRTTPASTTRAGTAARTTMDEPQPMMGATSTLAFPTGDRSTSVLLVEKTLPRQVRVGQDFDYQIKVTNLTDHTLTGVLVKEYAHTQSDMRRDPSISGERLDGTSGRNNQLRDEDRLNRGRLDRDRGLNKDATQNRDRLNNAKDSSTEKEEDITWPAKENRGREDQTGSATRDASKDSYSNRDMNDRDINRESADRDVAVRDTTARDTVRDQNLTRTERRDSFSSRTTEPPSPEGSKPSPAERGPAPSGAKAAEKDVSWPVRDNPNATRDFENQPGAGDGTANPDPQDKSAPRRGPIAQERDVTWPPNGPATQRRVAQEPAPVMREARNEVVMDNFELGDDFEEYNIGT